MSMTNTYPNPQDKSKLGQRGGKKAVNGSSHRALSNQKSTRGKTVNDDQNTSYYGSFKVAEKD